MYEIMKFVSIQDLKEAIEGLESGEISVADFCLKYKDDYEKIILELKELAISELKHAILELEVGFSY